MYVCMYIRFQILERQHLLYAKDVIFSKRQRNLSGEFIHVKPFIPDYFK